MSETTSDSQAGARLEDTLLDLLEQHHDQLVIRTNPDVGAESYIGYRKTDDAETTGWVHWIDYETNDGTITIRQTARTVAGFSMSANCELVMRSVAPAGLQLALAGFDIDAIETATQMGLSTWEATTDS